MWWASLYKKIIANYTKRNNDDAKGNDTDNVNMIIGISIIVINDEETDNIDVNRIIGKVVVPINLYPLDKMDAIS